MHLVARTVTSSRRESNDQEDASDQEGAKQPGKRRVARRTLTSREGDNQLKECPVAERALRD